MMKKAAVVLSVLILSVSACAGDEPADTTSPTEPLTATTDEGTTTTAPDTTTATGDLYASEGAIYLLGQPADSSQAGPYLVPVYREVDGVEEALRALLEGPSDLEQDLGLRSAISAGVGMNRISEDDDELEIDLTGELESGGGTVSMAARLAQLVFTVTRAADVESFTLLLDGEEVEVFSGEGIVLDQPLERAGSEVVPSLLVESPPALAPVSFPVEVSGMSGAGPVEYALTNWDGLIVAQGSVEIDEDGRFSFLVDPASDAPLENLGGAPFDGTLLVSSPEGGSSEYPLVFELEE